jgi:hypothetical protein
MAFVTSDGFGRTCLADDVIEHVLGELAVGHPVAVPVHEGHGLIEVAPKVPHRRFPATLDQGLAVVEDDWGCRSPLPRFARN